jgi:hypothetical protein
LTIFEEGFNVPHEYFLFGVFTAGYEVPRVRGEPYFKDLRSIQFINRLGYLAEQFAIEGLNESYSIISSP